MDRIESADGLFHEGNPAAGQKGTKVTAAWLNAAQEAVVGLGGDLVASAVEMTLTEDHGYLFCSPADGQTVSYHLPVYASSGPLKTYQVKNIGTGKALLNAADGKTIDGNASLLLLSGDSCEVRKDGANWRTIYIAGGGQRWYVDSVNGSDNNDGKSPAAAFQTIAKLQARFLLPNTMINLARGSYWREELRDLLADGITVASYGAGKLPTLDASDVAANGGFTKSGGYVNLYQVAWAHTLTENDSRISVWENSTRLTRATSIANAEATPGSFYAAEVVNGQPSTVYVHATGGGNVITNGKTYEITRRGRGLWLLDNSRVFGIHTKNNGSNNGSLQVRKGALVSGCLFEDGTKHSALIASGVMEDCVAWKNEIFAAAGNTTLFIAFLETGGQKVIFRRCKAIGSSTVLGGSGTGGTVGFYGHTVDNADPYESITYEDCEVLNLYQGLGGVANQIFINGGIGQRTSTHIMATALVKETITGWHANGYDNTVPLNNILAGVSPLTVITGMKAWVKDPNSALIWQDGDMSIEHSTFVMGDGIATNDYCVRIDAGVLRKFNNNIVHGCYKTAQLAAGVQLLAADNNVYHPQAWHQINGALFAGLAALHGTYPLLDANSIAGDPLFAGDPRHGRFDLQPTSPAWALQAGADMVTDFNQLYDYYGNM